VVTDDVLWFANHALDAMVGILDRVGDELVNEAPDLPGANSPYAIVTHCLGVLEWWGGAMVAGRPVERDRDAEFRARGRVAELVERVDAARRQLAEDLAGVVEDDPPHLAPTPRHADRPDGRTQGGVLLHVLEELHQHLGQLELTRDVLLAGR
jgi:Protein of unknown function (DUF664)